VEGWAASSGSARWIPPKAAPALEQTNLLLIAAAPEKKRGTGEGGEKGKFD
jgi:hypothetical protein